MRIPHEALRSRHIIPRGWRVAAWLRAVLKRAFGQIKWEEIGRLLAMRDDNLG
jgi:hypothetical protein